MGIIACLVIIVLFYLLEHIIYSHIRIYFHTLTFYVIGNTDLEAVATYILLINTIDEFTKTLDEGTQAGTQTGTQKHLLHKLNNNEIYVNTLAWVKFSFELQ